MCFCAWFSILDYFSPPEQFPVCTKRLRQTSFSYLLDFEIDHMLSDKIVLHSISNSMVNFTMCHNKSKFVYLCIMHINLQREVPWIWFPFIHWSYYCWSNRCLPHAKLGTCSGMYFVISASIMITLVESDHFWWQHWLC